MDRPDLHGRGIRQLRKVVGFVRWANLKQQRREALVRAARRKRSRDRSAIADNLAQLEQLEVGTVRSPDEARLVERFKRLAPQQKALLLALRPFSDDNGHFDRRRWEVAFESDEPERIVEVKAVTGLYEGLVNHLVEMLFAASRLRGLGVTGSSLRPAGPELIAAVGEDGGLTANQVKVLKRLYAMRNELQHASPGVEAGDVYDDVVLLTKTLARFARSYVEWLEQHGVTLV